MTTYERTGQPWRDDPAEEVMEELLHDFSEHIGTDGPEETFGHPREGIVGHLVDSPERRKHGVVAHDPVAWDTHDLEGLSAEESAMHYVDEDSLNEDFEPLPDEYV